MIWFNTVQSVDSTLMREIAQTAGVSWDSHAIAYRAGHVGYADAPDDAAKQPIIDAAQSEYGIILRDSEPPERDPPPEA